MMLINVSKNICCTSYVQRPGLSIQWGLGIWGKNRHMYRSWLSSTISPPPQAIPEPTSFFLNHCPYINACSVAFTIFHLLIIFNEPGAWPRHSIFSYAVKSKWLSPGQLCLLSKKKKKKEVPNPFCSKVKGKKPVAWWDHLSLFILPFSVEGWTEVLTVYRLVTEACAWSSQTDNTPQLQKQYQRSFMRNVNYPQKLISVYIFKTLGLRSRNPWHTFNMWNHTILGRCEYEIHTAFFSTIQQ